MKTIISIVCLFQLFLLNPVRGQVTGKDTASITEEQFLTGCALYRTHVIDGIVKVLVDFNLFCDSIQQLSLVPENHEKFRRAMMEFIYGLTSEEFDFDILYSKVSKVVIESHYLQLYMDWFWDNYNYLYEYSVLTNNNIIEKEYPFELTNNKSFWNEVNSYGFRKGMIIADIGTGSGFLPFILALSGFQGKICMTEIDSTLLSFIKMKEKNFNFPAGNITLSIIMSSEKHSGLESVTADRILLRETFHHLQHKSEMLYSLKESLRDGGLVCVFETVRDFVKNKKENCRKIIRKQKILDYFDKAGYKLVEDSRIDERAMLKFSLK